MNNTSFNVYPNPATDIINVEFSENFNGTVSVLDIAGKEVSTSHMVYNTRFQQVL